MPKVGKEMKRETKLNKVDESFKFKHKGEIFSKLGSAHSNALVFQSHGMRLLKLSYDI